MEKSKAFVGIFREDKGRGLFSAGVFMENNGGKPKSVGSKKMKKGGVKMQDLVNYIHGKNLEGDWDFRYLKNVMFFSKAKLIPLDRKHQKLLANCGIKK